MPSGIAIAGIAVAAIGTGVSMYEQERARAASKKANKFQRQMNELQNARQKIEVIRSGRQARAQAEQAASNQGMEGSSIGQGGSGSITSQTNSNLSFLSRYGFMSDQATDLLQTAANAQASAGMWKDIAGLGSQAYQASGGIKFKGPTPPPPPKTGQ
jgi:hypothetical protein